MSEWMCVGCGAACPHTIAPCDCATQVVRRGNKTGWKASKMRENDAIERLFGKLVAFSDSSKNSHQMQFSEQWFSELRETMAEAASAIAEMREALVSVRAEVNLEKAPKLMAKIEAALGIRVNEQPTQFGLNPTRSG